MNPTLKSCPCIARYAHNPVLSKENVPYDSDLVFNAGVIRWQGKYVMVFRNDYHHISGGRFGGTNIGIAFSQDGINWEVAPEPCFDLRDPQTAALFDAPEGEIVRCYDPRLTVIENEIYMSFAVDTRHGLQGGIAKTKDFSSFEVLSLSVPDNRNMVLFPEKINGMYMRLERPVRHVAERIPRPGVLGTAFPHRRGGGFSLCRPEGRPWRAACQNALGMAGVYALRGL